MAVRTAAAKPNATKQDVDRYKADIQDVALHFEKEALVQLKEFRDTNYLIVAAIDFGSTYSGYAFSSRFIYQTRPLDMSMATWTGSVQSLKTATCVLFKPDKTFHSFGFQAEKDYAQLVDQDDSKDWYFFRRFKMQLYNQKEIKWDMPLMAENGKTMPGLKVFSSCIKFLKEHMLELCKKQGLDVHRSDIRWVVTVPAIWSDDAKHFMRKAAEMADIPGPQLFLALEAEAAALFCKHLPVDKLSVTKDDHIKVFSPSSKYMVLDVGGGTVDITVHEVQNDLTLKEAHMATGGNWGGIKVDDEFENLIVAIVGDDVYNEFKKKHKSDYLELLRSFEVKKRTIMADDSDKKVTFSVPISLSMTFSDLCPEKDISDELSKNQELCSEVIWRGDKLRVSNKLAKSLFDKSLKNIKEHMQSLLLESSVSEVSAILLVGGYSECPLLQLMMKENFPDKRLIIPNEAGLTVLKGAVINGHEPDTITERICRYSYGVSICEPFIPGLHKYEYGIFTDSGMYCQNMFSKHLSKNQQIPLFVPSETKRYYVLNRDQTSLGLGVYSSSVENPFYTTEDSCRKLGKIEVEMRDTRLGLNRGVDVIMTIGGAELQVKAIDMHTRQKRFAYFDFIGSPSQRQIEELMK